MENLDLGGRSYEQGTGRDIFWDPNDSILGPLVYSLEKMMPTQVDVADSSTQPTHHLAASIL